MTPVADLRALLPPHFKELPIVCYFHENQLTYPLPEESERDYQYAFTNITSCLAADAVWFNSNYHFDCFIKAVEYLLKKMPDFVPQQIEEQITRRSTILPPGLEPELFELNLPKHSSYPPTVLWNHRWEYDKNPDEFFEVLFDLNRADIDFRVIVAGENFREIPPIFHAGQKTLTSKIDHFGFVPDRKQYLELLLRSDCVVSTAIHEFFGLAVLEAIALGCYPLLPNRLSYPELLPESLHQEHLYEGRGELRVKLAEFLENPSPLPNSDLRQKICPLSWKKLIERYDFEFEQIRQKRHSQDPDSSLQSHP
jgi:glycosyltransferase involved in cell wall biosynthesis